MKKSFLVLINSFLLVSCANYSTLNKDNKETLDINNIGGGSVKVKPSVQPSTIEQSSKPVENIQSTPQVTTAPTSNPIPEETPVSNETPPVVIETASDAPVKLDKLENSNISSNFSFKTTQDVSIEISAKDNAGGALNDVKFEIYNRDPEPEEGSTLEKGELIFSGVTDENGELKKSITIPSYLKELVIVTGYIGLPQKASITIKDGKVVYNLS
jgi:hypothetical protein